MKLGFLTACLPRQSLEQIADWAAAAGYEALEVAAWPALADRPFTAAHLRAGSFDPDDAERVRALCGSRGLEISSIAYYDNNLHPDPAERAAIHAHLRACIETAALVGCPTVGTFVGRNPDRTVAENLREAERVFPPLVDHAGERGVKLIVENCVMEGWHPDGYPGNLAYSPELWEWMFDLGLYLNYDPSHLLWLGIDPLTAITPYTERILHAQAKDIEIFPDRRNRFGWPGRAVARDDPWDTGWWRYRVPGRGQVDWRGVISALAQGGYDGVISVELEDPVLGGSEDQVHAGLEVAHRTLQPLLPPEGPGAKFLPVIDSAP
jgi:sugar phosphate isomerase/epimerase